MIRQQSKRFLVGKGWRTRQVQGEEDHRTRWRSGAGPPLEQGGPIAMCSWAQGRARSAREVPWTTSRQEHRACAWQAEAPAEMPAEA